MRNGRKYIESGFVHNMMDTVNADHSLVTAHVWPAMKTELPHNAIVSISVNSAEVPSSVGEHELVISGAGE